MYLVELIQKAEEIIAKCNSSICEYNKYNYIDGDFYCTNEHSDNYGVPTFYDDSCEDCEEKS